jgi:glycosyltransferase involved in cell wall biosynthesis
MNGAIKRTHEILKRGKAFGIEYVVALEREGYFNALKSFPSLLNSMLQYKVYLVDLGAGKSLFQSYKEIIEAAIILSKIIKKEKVNLIIAPTGGYRYIFLSYLTGRFSGTPWTAIYHLLPLEDMLGSAICTDTLVRSRTLDILKIIKNLGYARPKLSSPTRIILCLEFLNELCIIQKTTLLTVSDLIRKQLNTIFPKIRIKPIKPGNGIDLALYRKRRFVKRKYDCLFFGRLIPEKGLYDLVKIWKFVVQENPNALLEVAGLVIDRSFINQFLKMVSSNNLSRNVIFLGEQSEDKLIDLIKSSSLVLYPSYMDSFSLVILESLACGKPVVTYEIPPIINVYGECKAILGHSVGDIESMAKSIIELMESRNKLFNLSKEALAFSEKYDWNAVVLAEKEAYLEVIAQSI